jgi:protease-4
MWFKKKQDQAQVNTAPTNEKLSQVLDKHLTKYIRVVNLNNSVKTGMILFGLTLFMFNIFMGSFEVKKVDHIASIAFTGEVSAENSMANARDFSEHFQAAVKDENAKAILIIASSGGGSPTQAEGIHEVIKHYTDKPLAERKPVYVSVQDVCASACVMALASADKITAYKNSLIGSISVRMDGISLDKFLAKFEIERKVISTGSHKPIFDPYRSSSDDEKEFIKTNVMAPMHEHFVNTVIDGRGEKLDRTNELLFTGMIWTGEQSVKLGLADKIQTTYFLEEEMKTQFSVTEIKRYNKPPRFNLKSMLSTSFETAIENVMKSELSIRM